MKDTSKRYFRKQSKTEVTYLNASFFLLLISIILNINGVFSVFFSLGPIVSIIYLVTCLYIILTLNKYNIGVVLERKYLIYLVLFFYCSYLVLGLVSSFFSPSYTDRLLESIRSHFSSLLVIFAIYKFIIYSFQKGTIEYWSNIILLLLIVSSSSGFIIDFLGLAQYGNYKSTERYSGFFGNPNELGIQINYTLTYLLGRPFFYSNRKNYLLILVPVLLIFSVLTFSRSSIILSVIILLVYSFYLILNRENIQYLIKYIFLVLLLLYISSSILNVNSLITSFSEGLSRNQTQRIDAVQDLLSGEINEQSTKGRYELANYAMELINDRPILGYGLDTFHSFNGGNGAHNTYLMIWGEAGILGLIIWLFLLGTLFINGLKISKDLKFTVLVLVMLFVIRSFSTHSYLDDRNFNLMIAFVCTAISIKLPKKLLRVKYTLSLN